MKLWGGRFKGEENKAMEDFNKSLNIDKKMYEEDIEGSIAHAKMLSKCSIISSEEEGLIVNGLLSLLNDIKSGKLLIEGDYEDIHSFVESNLIKSIGDVGKKLHTARSRNDQVALDLRMFLKKNVEGTIDNLNNLISTIENIREDNFIMPGYTHLQRAQVVTFGYYMDAYRQMFKRDVKRLINALELMDESPLGCCALAGTTYDIDRNFTSQSLNFKRPAENFMDGVSDRDFVIEVLSDFSIAMMHLSRLSEELILFCTQEFGFVTLSDMYSTGSSIMPQKKNPDSLELIRGKTGRVYGDLMAILTVMKGLPLAYNKDMQEDKEIIFDAIDTLNACLNIMNGVLSTIKINAENMLKAVKKGFLNATDLADYLVLKGVPFRDAHKITGQVIIYCEETDKVIEELNIDEFKKFSSLIENDVYDYIDLKSSLKRGIKKEIKGK